MDILKTLNLKKYYGSGNTVVKALDGVDFSVADGEFTAIVGTSGSGKSTLLHLLGGLDRPTEGKVIIAGKDIFSLEDNALTIFRRRKIDKKHTQNVIEVLGLSGKETRLPSQLSGGQQQRVAIARALAAKPAIILADEPTGNLDSKTSLDVLGLMKISGEKFKQTIVMITHNDAIAQMADRIIRIEDGRIAGEHNV